MCTADTSQCVVWGVTGAGMESGTPWSFGLETKSERGRCMSKTKHLKGKRWVGLAGVERVQGRLQSTVRGRTRREGELPCRRKRICSGSRGGATGGGRRSRSSLFMRKFKGWEITHQHVWADEARAGCCGAQAGGRYIGLCFRIPVGWRAQCDRMLPTAPTAVTPAPSFRCQLNGAVSFTLLTCPPPPASTSSLHVQTMCRPR